MYILLWLRSSCKAIYILRTECIAIILRMCVSGSIPSKKGCAAARSRAFPYVGSAIFTRLRICTYISVKGRGSHAQLSHQRNIAQSGEDEYNRSTATDTGVQPSYI